MKSLVFVGCQKKTVWSQIWHCNLLDTKLLSRSRCLSAARLSGCCCSIKNKMINHQSFTSFNAPLFFKLAKGTDTSHPGVGPAPSEAAFFFFVKISGISKEAHVSKTCKQRAKYAIFSDFFHFWTSIIQQSIKKRLHHLSIEWKEKKSRPKKVSCIFTFLFFTDLLTFKRSHTFIFQSSERNPAVLLSERVARLALTIYCRWREG